MNAFIGYIYFINQSKPKRMKKKIFVFRFGMPTPTKADFVAVSKLGADVENGEVFGTGSPFGLCTLLHTDKSPAEVKQAYLEAEQEVNDELPIIVIEESQFSATNLVTMGFEGLAKMNEVFDADKGITKSEGIQCTLSLDELLDRVNQVGIKGLTPQELTRLQELSK